MNRQSSPVMLSCVIIIHSFIQPFIRAATCSMPSSALLCSGPGLTGQNRVLGHQDGEGVRREGPLTQLV